MYKISDIGKIQDILQPGINLLSGKSHHGAVQIYIFDTCVLHVKTGSQFQKRRNPSIYNYLASCRIQYACNNLQDSGFTGTVCADDSHCLASFDIEAHIMQGIVLPDRYFEAKSFFQSVRRFVIQFIHLVQIFYLNCKFTHFRLLLQHICKMHLKFFKQFCS